MASTTDDKNYGGFNGGREGYGGPHFSNDVSSIGGVDTLCLGHNNADKIIVVKGSGVLKRGTILGMISGGADDGKFTVAKAAAADGSAEADKVLCYDLDATAADVQAVAYYEGSFDRDRLIFGEGHTPKTVAKAFRLKNIGIENPLG